MMRTFYNGYRFSRNAEEQVYNPTLALYFLKVFQRDCRYPDRILDSNLAMNRGKMHYISRLPEGRQLIFDALAETESIRFSSWPLASGWKIYSMPARTPVLWHPFCTISAS